MELQFHSAKTFNRPEWQKLLVDLKKQKNRPDLMLFTKWDRFSRNAPDAYQMIGTLRVLGVEPQAIEQPLDMSRSRKQNDACHLFDRTRNRKRP